MFQRIDHGDELAGLLRMVAFKGPILERAGGCTIETEEKPNGGKPLPEEVRAEFARLLGEGKSLRQIATETGWPYSTVCDHTRHLRT